MKRRKNTVAKVFAFIALFWIILWIIWTGALFIFWNSKVEKEQIKTINPKQLEQILKNAELQSWAIVK
jgi:hypothetical protein